MTAAAATKPAFSKGELVTLINNWDRNGTVSFRHAVVYSCGLKRMILTDAVTGEEIGRDFQPVRAVGFEFGTRERLTDEAATALGLKLSEHFRTEERARLENCIVRHPDDGGYIRSIAASIAKLDATTPRAANIEVLHAEIVAKVKADTAARRQR